MGAIGIIGAMEEEVSCLKDKMSEVKVTRKASMDFYEGVLEGKAVVVVRSGIGKVNAAVCTQILADTFQVEAIINTGIAGSLNNEINIGDIVLSTDVLHHDMDATGFGYPKCQIPQMEEFSFPGNVKMRETALSVCREVNPEIQVFEGRIASGLSSLLTQPGDQSLRKSDTVLNGLGLKLRIIHLRASVRLI